MAAGVEEKYRTCLDTGLRVYRKAETLIKVNAVTAVIFLAVGGLLRRACRADAMARVCIYCRPTCSTWC